jgi:hypothetical protein
MGHWAPQEGFLPCMARTSVDQVHIGHRTTQPNPIY